MQSDQGVHCVVSKGSLIRAYTVVSKDSLIRTYTIWFPRAVGSGRTLCGFPSATEQSGLICCVCSALSVSVLRLLVTKDNVHVV